MKVDEKKAQEALWEIVADLNEAITECENKELQDKLLNTVQQVKVLCEAINIQPAHNNIKLLF